MQDQPLTITADPNTIDEQTWQRYTAERDRYIPRGVTVARMLRDVRVRHAAAHGWN